LKHGAKHARKTLKLGARYIRSSCRACEAAFGSVRARAKQS